MYQKGSGVGQDFAQAARWYTQSAEQGDPRAQFYLGVLYLKGEGVSKDDVIAYKWTNIASALAPHGKIRVLSAKARNFLERRMTGGQISRSQGLARDWMAKHFQKK